MNNFNMKRFGQVLKLDIYQNSRTYLNMAAGCFIAHLLSQLACFYVAKLNLAVTVYSALAQEHNQHSAMTASLVVCCLITFFSFLLGASLLWNNLGTKEQRITYLMLPATNLEKYLSRLLLCTVGMLGINAVAFFAADVLRMLAFCTSSMAMGFALPHYVDRFGEIFHNYAQMLHLAANTKDVSLLTVVNLNVWISTLLTYPATFMFGSVIFRRYAFIKTWLCLMVWGTIISTLMLNMAVSENSFELLINNHGETFVWANLIWDVAWSCIFIWLSYHLFVKMNVIRRKMF